MTTCLVELDTPRGLLRFAEYDMEVGGLFYRGGLLSLPVPTRRLSDGGMIEASDVSLAIADPRGLLLAAYEADAPRRLRGRVLTVKLWDGSAALPRTEWTGIVARPRLNPGRLDLEGTTVDRSRLEEDVPRGTVGTAEFPNAVDAGARVPIALAGNVPRVRLLYVNEDDANQVYDYLAPTGAVSLDAFYRLGEGGTMYAVEALRTVKTPTFLRVGFTGASKTQSVVIAGTDRLLLVAIGNQPASAVSAMTYNGVALTRIGYAEQVAAGHRVEWWMLVAPATGTHDLVVTLGASGDAVLSIYGLIGTKQDVTTTDFDFTTAQAGSASTAVTVTQPSADGDLVLDCVCFGATPVVRAYPGAGQADLTNSVQGTRQVLASREDGDAPSIVMSWTLSSGKTWLTASIRVKAAPSYVVSGALYTGRLVARFREKQVSPTTQAALPILADVTGPAAERNAVRAVRTFLSNADWGLGNAVDADAFDAAEAALAPASSHLYCDGLIGPDVRKVQDVLGDLLAFGNGRLSMTPAGAWTIAVETGRPAVADLDVMVGADGPRALAIRDRCPPSLDESVSNLVLRYRYYQPTADFVLPVSRVVSSVGKQRTMTNRFVQDNETADRLVDREAKRLLAADEGLSLDLPPDALALDEGGLVQVTDPLVGLSAPALYEAKEVAKPGRVRVQAQGYDQNWNVYTPGMLPADPTLGSAVDFARTPPLPASDLSVAAGGTEIGPDGTSLAYVVLAFDVPAVNVSQAQVRYRASGDLFWEDAGITTNTGPGVQLRVSGLIPGQNYDFTVRTVNIPGTLTSTGDPALYGQTASVVGLPTAPTSLTLSAFGRAVFVIFNGLPSLPFDGARLYRNTVNTWASATKVAEGKQLAFVNVVPTTGTWHFWGTYVSAGVESGHTA